MRSTILTASVSLWLVVVAGLVVFQSPSSTSFAETAAGPDSLKSFLQNYVGLPTPETRTTRYLAAFKDLNNDGVKEAVVYLSGDRWCGSGGCATLILQREGKSYRMVTKITITRPPIRVLDGAVNGWVNIGVWVQGGGIGSGYEAELRFDGKSYPTNPSLPPARRRTGNVHGQVLIPRSRSATPLYP